jgi:Tol biopolymer transport system component
MPNDMPTRNAVKTALIFLILSSSLFGQEYPVKQVTFCDSMHDGYPYWTRDSKFIIYDSGSRSGCHAMKIPSTGGTAVKLTECFSQHSHLSPDGKKLVFDGDFGSVIQMTDIGGSAPVRVVPPTIPIVHSGYPRWSTDGKMIAFQSGADIWIMEVEKKDFRKIYHADGKVTVPFCWVAGDQDLLIDVRDTVARKSEIWRISLDGKAAKQLTRLDAYSAKADLSPDGSMILFSSNHGGNFDVWVMKADGGTPVQLTFYKGDAKNPGFDMEASWSPDGSRIAFSSTRSNYWAIWVMVPDVKDLKRKLGIQP